MKKRQKSKETKTKSAVEIMGTYMCVYIYQKKKVITQGILVVIKKKNEGKQLDK